MKRNQKVTAVSFGGGGRAGAGRHIAAAERFRNTGIAVWLGTSIGGFIAVLVANGYSKEQMLDAMYRLWRPTWRNTIRAIVRKPVNPVKLLKGDETQLARLCAMLGLVDPTEHIKHWCKGLEWKNAAVVLLDLRTGERVVVNSKFGMPLYLALRATMSVPGVFAPVYWTDRNGRKYVFVDGGMSHGHATVEGHKTAIVKCLSFPGRDLIWKNQEGDVSVDIGVMPGLGILFPPSRQELEEQVREAELRIASGAAS